MRRACTALDEKCPASAYRRADNSSDRSALIVAPEATSFYFFSGANSSTTFLVFLFRPRPRCGSLQRPRNAGISSNQLTSNLPRNLPVKNLWKSVKTWQSYGHGFVTSLFWSTLCVYGTYFMPPPPILWSAAELWFRLVRLSVRSGGGFLRPDCRRRLF